MDMNVKLVPHVGINLVTGREQCHEQYFVYAGHPAKMERVGLIGWKTGSKLIFLVPVDPIREEAIREEVAKQIKFESEILSHPDIPEDLIHPPKFESDLDEFNESDLT